MAESKQTERLLRHVVLFAFKESAMPDDVSAVEVAFGELPGKIEAIHDFEWGTDVSVENAARGFTHCFFVTFRNEADRDAYLPHPAHREFSTLLRPHLEQSLVLDYWARG